MTKFAKHYMNILDRVLDGLPMFVAYGINITIGIVVFAILFWMLTGISLV